MIDLSQWRTSIGIFNSRVNSGYVDRDYSSSLSNVLLHTVLTVIRDVAVLQLFVHVYVVTVLLLLLCGDIEMKPGPVYTLCPNCNIRVHIRKKICECGYVLHTKGGRKMGTSNPGFSGSAGRPPANVDIELNVPIGRPNSNDDIELDVPIGRPTSNDDVELDVPIGRPTSNDDIELKVPVGRPNSNSQVDLDVPIGHPYGTINNSFSISNDKSVNAADSTDILTSVNCVVEDTEVHDDRYESTTTFIEDNLALLVQHMKQYDLPSAWDTDKTKLSLSNNLLARAKKRIGQQVRFDAKPLGTAMCYCCGSILWSRVDNSHTHLVKLDLDDTVIPAVAYQRAMEASSKGFLDYRHKSGKLYSCSVCKSFKNSAEYIVTFHIGKTNTVSTIEWDMAYPPQVTCLKTEVEKCQVALCGIFSTTIKDAKKHQWRHIQGEVNALHKLDRHYYGMFGFLMINETITEKLTKYSETCERIRVALNWFKKNNNLYKQFLARFETMYRYLRHDIINPDILKGNQDKILESEAIGMAFPIDSEYFDQYSPLYGDLDIAGIQNPQPHMIDKVQDSVEWLRKCTSVQYGQEYLLEKTFPHLFPYGEGGWYYKSSLGFSQFTKIRLLDPRGYFANDGNFPFFMFDYMTKIRLRSFNARKVVTTSKLEENLTAGKVMMAERPMSDPYDSYGTEVPRVIPGSKQYWKSFGYDLVAMTEQLGIPDFFLTLSPNDNWPHIQSTIRKGWGASADPSEFQDLSCKPDNEQAVGPNPLESVLGAEKRFSAMMDILLDKKSGPLGIVVDFAVKKEYQKRGGLHWHILFWVQPGSTPDNVVLAEMPRSADTQNVQAQYARKMVQKYQMHRECYPDRCFKGYAGKILTKCKYGFPFKVPQLNEELDEDGIRFLYTRRCKEDQLVVPYNLEILLFWGASMNIQRVARHGFEMYLAKYISKPESSFNVKLSQNPTEPEKYLRTRVIGACEAIDVQLGFNQYHLSRGTVFLVTELKPQRQFLKHRVQLASLPQDSEDIYLSTKYQLYLLRNNALRDITYPAYFQWWRKSTYTEQCKGEKATEKGLTPLVGFKGVDEFEELKASTIDLTDKFDKLGDTLKAKNYLYNAIQTVINATAKNDNTAVMLKTIFLSLNHNLKLGDESSKTEITEHNTTEPSKYEITEDSATEFNNTTEGSESEPSEHEITEDTTTAGVNITEEATEPSESRVTKPSESEDSEPSENELAEALTILKDIGLFDSSTNRPKKLHWLHTKLLQTYSNDEIQSSAIYGILERYPPGSMLADSNGTYWVRRANAAVTRHRFITIDDQETYYEQKYLLTVPLTATDSIVSEPPSSWVKAAMEANLVDEQHDARATLMDAVKRGFSLENIRSIVKVYVEHQFLDEDEADAFLTTLPTGTSSKEEVREVTDQLLDDQEGGSLLPPHHVPLEEYTSKFTASQQRAFNWLKNCVEQNSPQILVAVIGAAGCGKSFVMGAMVEYLRQCNLVVTKLAPSGVAASLIKGTTIHNFFKIDISGKSSLENGTVDASLVKKTDVLIIDELSMIDCTLFITIEHLCRRFSTKDNRYKPWGGRHVLLFGDPAQLPPVSNTDIFNTKIWLNSFSVMQLKEPVRAKDPTLSAALLKIREGIIDDEVASLLKNRLRDIDIASVDLTRTVIICSRRKEVDVINAECLNYIDGNVHEYVAIDTDTNGQPLREADKQRLTRNTTRMPDKISLKEGCRVVLRRNLQISEGWVNGAMCEVLAMTPNCILVSKIGFPNKKYPIPRTKQKIDIKGASYSILRSQFPVQLAYAVTVHRVQGLTVDKAIVILNHNFFASGQAYVALSRVRTADNLILWSYTPSAIKIAPYYKQLLLWCDSIDVIRSPCYDGPPVRYPDRQHDQISCTNVDDELNHDLDTGCLSSAPIRMPDSHNTVDQSNDTVTINNFKPVPNPTQSKKKNIRKSATVNTESMCSTQKMATCKRRNDTVTINNSKSVPNPTQSKRKNVKKAVTVNTESMCPTQKTTTRKRKGKTGNQPLKKPKLNDDCMIIDTVNVIGPNRSVWPEYCYYQTDETWQQQACTRLGIRFVYSTGFQPGGPDTVLTRPDLRSLRNVGADGNCYFRALSYIITGSETQHMEIREGILSYMLTIQHLLIGRDSSGHANFLVPFNVRSVQQYIDNSGMARNSTWGTDVEILCFSHMFNFNVYVFNADSNTWAVFSPVNIERRLPRIYNIMSTYLYLRNSHFYVIASIRRM